MGNFCSVPIGLNEEGSEQGGHLDLIGQLSYDIYKIQGDTGWRDDSEEDRFSRRNTKRFYEVRKSPMSRTYSQVLSFRSGSSPGMSANTSNWTRSQQHSPTELTDSLEELPHARQQWHTTTSTPSSPRSESSSGTSAFEFNQSHHNSPAADLDLEEPARVEKSA